MKKYYNAFTLAEVLITLGIIGIVAAMTIPTLVANYQKTQYVAELKKAYATINQALLDAAIEQGCIDSLVCAGLYDTNSGNGYEAFLALKKKLKVSKECAASEEGCMSSAVYLLTDTSTSQNLSLYDSFVTVDGASVSCSNTECMGLYIDTNGLKGPNIWGRDVFAFNFDSTSTKIIPRSYIPSGGIRVDCSSTVASEGKACSGRIMQEGWQMNY